jgi:hypothetical protein
MAPELTFNGKVIPKISDAKFNYENGAEQNRVFLYENIDHDPFIGIKKGWEIVGYGKAPWPGSSDGFAVMIEKKTPAQKRKSMYDDEEDLFDEGTQIWQHFFYHYFTK